MAPVAASNPVDVDRSCLACATLGCKFRVHTRREMGGYCCLACCDGGPHGERCEQIVAPEGAQMADAAWKPVTGKELEELDKMHEALQKMPAHERAHVAGDLKEAGNASLKAGDPRQAVIKYADGIVLLDMFFGKYPPSVSPELLRRVTPVYVALHLNSAQACLKQSEWAKATEHANRALSIDHDNAKALYRRGVACMHFDNESRIEQARADFSRLTQLEPTNREAREQLQHAKERLREARQTERGRFAGALKGGALYQEQHVALDKQRLQYDEDMKRCSELGEPVISFESWQDKQRDEEEAVKTRAREQEDERWSSQNLEDSLAEQRRAEQTRQPTSTGCDDVELDEEERKLLKEAKHKGYYHGRLNTVLSDAAPVPKRLASDELSSAGGGQCRGSEWNLAGTWEEKDMTSWVKEQMSIWLMRARVCDTKAALSSGEIAAISAEVTGVKSLDGDAQVITVRQQRRFCLNFEAEVSFKMTIAEDDETGGFAIPESFEGTLSLPELADATLPEKMRIVSAWVGEPPSDRFLCTANKYLEILCREVRAQLSSFLREYRQK